jgi:hypothetical protein
MSTVVLFDRRILQVSQPELEVAQPGLPGLGGAKGDDLLRVVDGDDLAAPQGQQLAEQSLAGSQVRDVHRRQ